MKKKASDLRAGDIVVTSPLPFAPGTPVPAPERRLVVGVLVPPDGSQMTALYVPHPMLQPGRVQVSPMHAMPEYEVHVQDRRTPAEQHAEQLVDLVRQALGVPVAGMLTPGWRRVARELLDEVDPPVPPTAVELIAALMDLREEHEDTSTVTRRADSLIERARRAGLIGGAQ